MTIARALFIVCAVSGLWSIRGQDLTPRAYVITPVKSNAVILSFGYNAGGILLDPTVPITDLKSQFQVPIVSGYHSFALFGRSANIVVALPYSYGHFEGKVFESQTRIARSGLADARVRLAVNLHGGPAMKLPEYAKYRERTSIGVSLTTVLPTGQYDPAKLVNNGANRWAFKPEVGISRRWGRWVVDGYAGAWFFGTNSQFFPGTTVRKQNAITALEFHLEYYVRPRLWLSFDSNFWSGGNTILNGVEDDDRARNSRVGGTTAITLTRHQTFKFSASRGAIVRIGGNFTLVTAAWQYSWIGKPL